MPRDPLIGLVGKPSSGKSTTLNSLTDATSKVGNFPFTTIDPQRAIGYLQIECACQRYGVSDKCRPNYGGCIEGRRSVPIELLDVAGLVPGAHQGRGLGNKFLDDLRHADALIHVVDVSGTTDAEGKATRGYDPSQDIEWLHSEIVRWVLGNLMQRWGSIKRRHMAIKATAVDTLQGQFSGYGSTSTIVARCLDRIGLKEPLENWSDETVEKVVKAFIDEKFPTVYALNKIDHPDADKNISKIAKMQDPQSIVLCSAISEVFLRRLAKQNYIKYVEGSEFLDTREDLIDMGEPDGGGLKEMDEKLKTRVENLKDMVLYRFGSTGVVQCLSRAAELLGLVPVFPVRNIHTFASGAGSDAAFRDCVLVKKGTTVGDVAHKVMGDIPISYIEGVGGIRVSEDEIVQVGKHDVGVNLSITKLILVANSHPSFLGTILQAWPIDFSIQFIYS
ncbi:P-loop containing nucleoside triphosphate hydrolase protein [Aspergillus flavus]|uniref:P-loop containing nucleoside triphosphate hydrolase protein n=1 Tax=Aspergillus flavus (strain ATCC 200026 / FGSC A1120 / IAM 13836 / NRRL 3357 / JCM 12722 / SRRC 167) TaxID=332952 RepID=A0A7U2R0J5_ASPFN|nr:P-loop containing nucleoside triphosphate hydrolase protein [Aspergillus flavus]